MEATRVIYWNIGHVSVGFMYLLAFIATLFPFYSNRSPPSAST